MNRGDDPVVSVILVTYNSEARVERFIVPLVEAFAASGVAAEIIAVDNASTDRTVNRLIVACPTVRVDAHARNLGFATGCNRGARLARAQWLWFCNDDLVITPTSIERMWHSRRAGECLVPVVRGVAGDLQNAIVARWRKADLKLDGQADPLDFVAYPMGCCMLIDRSVFLSVGGFDERFWPAYYEDAALGIALWRAGYRVRMLRDVTVTHYGQGGTGAGPSPAVRNLVYERRWLLVGIALGGWRRALALFFGLPRTAAESYRTRDLHPVLGYLRFWRGARRNLGPLPAQAGRMDDTELLATLRKLVG
jgi:GT2 family glycosyltransferase